MNDTQELIQKFGLRGSILTRTVSVGELSFTAKVKACEGGTPDLESWWRSYLAGNRPLKPSDESPKLRLVDLFCGPGGLAIGFRQAAEECGFTTESVVAVDQDEGALAVYQKNHSSRIISSESVSMLVNFQILGSGDDATMFSAPKIHPKWEHLVGNVDVILAGPPCQGHSNLNNHSRRNDERNALYLTVPAIAIALNAPMVVIENVPAVVHDHQGVVSTSISLLKEAGYNIQFGTLCASDMGWPQTRKRYFIVASKQVDPISMDVINALLARENPLSVWWAISDFAKKRGTHFMDRLPILSATNESRVKYLIDNDLHNLPNSERPDCHKDGTTYTAVYGRMHKNKPAPTLTCGFLSPGRGRFTHPTQPRVLTPREAARIQGFPDTYIFDAVDGVDPKKTQLAKWIGDAVPMPLGFAAGLCILMPLLSSNEKN
jgi:DNA (cytosine-5)-methyltransferase 1